MKKSIILLTLLSILALGSCTGPVVSSSSESTSGSSKTSESTRPESSSDKKDSSTVGPVSSSSTPVQPGHTEEEIKDYMNNLKNTSAGDHLYVHYYRYAQTTVDYNQWDVWCWPYKPRAGEGYNFDWFGRTTSADRMSATGDAVIDPFGYVHADIDLTLQFNGGWNNTKKTIGGTPSNFYQKDGKTLDTEVGVQIVMSATRKTASKFWSNDGGDVTFELSKYAMTNTNGTTSYHIFFTQDKVPEPTMTPPATNEDPFDGDTGEKYTYGKAEYSNVKWNDKKPVAKTSPAFLSGGNGSSLAKGAGVGYQIMVSSFADSDKDGSGDIYGITKKIPYLKDLGVNVLWLTPIQLSVSYHGYDISDYTQVDPKFGSKESTYSRSHNGFVDSNSAMEDYKELLKVAHENGMAVIMDLVLNHTSTTNNWFIKSAKLDETHRGYYQWGNNVKDKSVINQDNYWYPYGDHVYSYYAKFGSQMPELNYAYVSTRAAVLSMALNWCSIGVDGFRMDAVKHIFMEDEVKADANDTIVSDVSESGNYSSNITKNLHFWNELNYEVKKVYPNAFFVGENFDGHAYHVAPYYGGFDSLFDFYSYFNLTSIAARSFRNGSSGAFALSAKDFLGDYNTQYGNPYSANSDSALKGNKTSTIKYGGSWNLRDVYNTNNQYRGGSKLGENTTTGYDMISGSFTSNHDIARAINRIAGNKWTPDGLEAQGNVSTSNYKTLDQLATCVEIAELMLPGCTWIYYGDEIGMTGNFPQGTDANTGYADLWYRQPMKWMNDNKTADADGIYTTDYNVTGSAMTVKWDEINSTNTVAPVSAQKGKTGSHYEAIKAFAKAKGTTPALIKGNFVPYNWGSEQYVLNFLRKLGNEEYQVVVNLGSNKLEAGLPGTVVASFNGASKTSIPARSAILLKTK